MNDLKATLAALVAKHGMAAVLAEARNLLSDEADELMEMENEADERTARRIDAVASQVLQAAAAYDLVCCEV
jgi:cytoplasmic iron level regulating protein YaaA (DUF328/UPF0246 family)